MDRAVDAAGFPLVGLAAVHELDLSEPLVDVLTFESLVRVSTGHLHLPDIGGSRRSSAPIGYRKAAGRPEDAVGLPSNSTNRTS